MAFIFSDYLPGTLATNPQVLTNLIERQPLLV
jgi:hypothetical protein